MEQQHLGLDQFVYADSLLTGGEAARVQRTQRQEH
jgi:hypothetical protein